MNATCQRRFGRSTCVEVHRSLNHIPLSCLVRRCRFAYYSVKPHIDTHNRHRPPFLLSLLCNHVVVEPHRHLADTRVRYMAFRNSDWGISMRNDRQAFNYLWADPPNKPSRIEYNTTPPLAKYTRSNVDPSKVASSGNIYAQARRSRKYSHTPGTLPGTS